MKTLYLDTFAGISGDMFLGLLFDLGIEPLAISAQLSRLKLDGYQLGSRPESRCGIAGTRALVEMADQQPHRTWRDIDALLAGAQLEPADRDLARRIFLRLGRAEAAVHGVPLEQIHFHEVGAVDAIVDIVGAAIGLNRLAVDQVICAPLPLTSGQVKTAHGLYPLPAPAVLEILKGHPTRSDDAGVELVTPTGAAIAAEIATFGPLPEMTVKQIGYGVGSREMAGRPNLLRGLLGTTGQAGGDVDTVTLLETHLDDCNPEWLGALMETLLGAGALDVAFSPLQMKKNRPGQRVTVVAPPAKAAGLEQLLLRQSSSIGVRRSEATRTKLQRQEREVLTPLGAVRVKCLYQHGQLIRVTPEHDSCRALAQSSKRPLPEVYRLAERAADALFEPGEEG